MNTLQGYAMAFNCAYTNGGDTCDAWACEFCRAWWTALNGPPPTS